APARNRDQGGARSSMPRPGVSYISGAEQDNRQRTPRSTLPQVPQIQRADNAGRPAAIREEQMPRSAASQPPMVAPEPAPPAARYQRAEPSRPAYTRNEAPPQRMQQPSYQPPREQPRVEQPRYEAPRYAQPQQRAAPPVRAEAARPQRSEAHQERKSEPRSHDDRQHQ